MSLTAVIILSALDVFLLMPLVFIMVVFAGAATGAPGAPVSPSQWYLLDTAVYAIPALCPLSAGIVIVAYTRKAGALAYGWYALPIIATVAFIVYVFGWIAPS